MLTGTVEIISTRAPRTEGDSFLHRISSKFFLFQPAPPARRATWRYVARYSVWKISTRAPRTEGDRRYLAVSSGPMRISTRAPRTEGDLRQWSATTALCHFNPRPPHGGRPARAWRPLHFRGISTRAPRTEGDHLGRALEHRVYKFQPAPPARRATIWRPSDNANPAIFQPAPPARRATREPLGQHDVRKISTRAPRTEGDMTGARNPRRPVVISTRAPRTEGDTRSR